MDFLENKPEAAGADAQAMRQTLAYDYKLYWHDILGSIAHAKMMGETGILAKEESERIADGLVGILADIEKGLLEPGGAEDIRTFVENELIKRIGAVGKKIATARSANDVAATDLRLYMKDVIVAQSGALRDLVETLLAVADENIKYYMPGYAHGKNCQPVNVAHFFNAYSEMFLRDIERLTDCYKRTDVMPLGSGALSGTNFPIDRKMTAELLGFSELSQNSMDAVSDRDFALEYLFAATAATSHLGRLAGELIRLSSDELNFIRIGDEFTAPDPVIPERRYPDILEIVRGKSARTAGNLAAALGAVKDLPLSAAKDAEEVYAALFDTRETVDNCVNVMTSLLKSLSFDTRAMRFAAAGNYSAAGDVTDYLVNKGMTVRDARAVTAEIVRYCAENSTAFDRLDEFTFQNFSTLFAADITETVKVKNVAENKKQVGGTSRAFVRENIRSIQRRLQRMFK